MKTLLLVLSLAASPAFALEAGAVPQPAPVVAPPAPAVALPAVPVLAAAPVDPAAGVAVFDNPLGSIRGFYVACKEGKWGLAAALLLFGVVGFLRTTGKKVHDWLDDANPIDKYLFHPIFDTTIGGWVLNWATAVGGVLGVAYLAGMPVDGAAWRTAVLSSTGSTALIELWKDLKGWWDARQAAKSPTPAVAPVKPA